MKSIALVLLSGSSTRFGGDLPKIFKKVKDKPLFIFPLEVLSSSTQIDEIILVTKPEFKKEIQSYIEAFKINKVTQIIQGGETRSESVFNGLNEIKEMDSNVLICDGDRPNLTEEIISRNIEGIKVYDGVVTAVKAVDSTFMFKDQMEYVDRTNLYNAQTPQTFKAEVIKKAYSSSNYKNFTDDASICIKLGYNIGVVEGSYLNYKITTVSDFERFEAENI